MKQALQNGADPNTTFSGRTDTMTCLEQAAATGDLEMIGHLLDHGARPNMRVGEYTALHSASQNGHVKAIELLLKRGAKAPADGLRSVLDIAVLNRQKEVTQFWVKHGVPITEQTMSIAKSVAEYDHGTTAGRENLDWLQRHLQKP